MFSTSHRLRHTFKHERRELTDDNEGGYEEGWKTVDENRRGKITSFSPSETQQADMERAKIGQKFEYYEHADVQKGDKLTRSGESFIVIWVDNPTFVDVRSKTKIAGVEHEQEQKSDNP